MGLTQREKMQFEQAKKVIRKKPSPRALDTIIRLAAKKGKK
jgi:hypothetical protein